MASNNTTSWMHTSYCEFPVCLLRILKEGIPPKREKKIFPRLTPRHIFCLTNIKVQNMFPQCNLWFMCHATHKPIYKMAKSELNKKKSHKKNLDLGSLQKTTIQVNIRTIKQIAAWVYYQLNIHSCFPLNLPFLPSRVMQCDLQSNTENRKW